MADIKPIGIDQTTGQQRQITGADTVIDNIGNQIQLKVTNVGDYSGIPNIATIVHPWENPTLIDNSIATLPSTEHADSSAWSPNDEYHIVTTEGATGYQFLKRTGSNFTTLTPSTLPSQAGHPAWDNSGKYLAVPGSSPTLMLYTQDGNTLTKLSDPTTLPTGTGRHSSWTHNSEFLAIAHNTTPFLTAYHRDGTTFARLSNPTTLPAGQTFTCNWTPDGQYLVLGEQSSRLITVYQKTGLGSSATLTALTGPSSLPSGGTVGRALWDPTGEYLAVGSNGTPSLVLYQRSGTTLTLQSTPASLPVSPQRIIWHPTGDYLGVADFSGGIDHLKIYQHSAGTLTLLTSPSSVPNFATGGRGLSWSHDGQFLSFQFSRSADSYQSHMYQTSQALPDTGIVFTRGNALAD